MRTIADNQQVGRAGPRLIQVAIEIAAALAIAAFARPAAADLERWEFLTGDPNAIPIRAIAVDPQDPSTIYVGVSNGAIAYDSAAQVPEQGAGILKTTDGGGSWSTVNLGLTDLMVVAIVVDPLSPSTVYAATDGGGVFKSTTGGASWSAANSGLPADLEVYAFAIDPATPSTLYAGLEHDGVFKSTDGGASWSAANVGLDGSELTLEIWALAVDPQNTAVVYAGTKNRVFRSTNAGATWTQTGTMSWTNSLDGSTQYSQWIYALAVDYSQPQTVYAGVLDAGGVFRSDDGGQTWNGAREGINYYNGYSYITALAIDPQDPDTIYAGTQDRGVFKTTNGGALWAPLNAGTGGPGVYALGLDGQDPALLYSGTSLGDAYRLGSEPLDLDYYRCFRAKGSRVEAPLVTLIDDFEARMTVVGKPKTFCEPVSLSGSTVVDPTTFLTCYAISRGDYAGPQVIGVDHQMSGSRVANVRPSTVCLPTEKQGTPAAGNLNHFKGYRGKRTRAPVFPASLDGDLGSQQAKFYRYAAVMTPVDVDGAGMVDPTAHLMCLELVYRDRGFEIPEPSFTSQEVTIENELGTQTIEITKPDALCLPSLRTYTLP